MPQREEVSNKRPVAARDCKEKSSNQIDNKKTSPKEYVHLSPK